MTTYLLNTPVLTSFGRFDFQPISLAEAKAVLAEGFDSAVGHASTAEALTTLLGIGVPHRRVTIAMQPGDRAVVFRLLERPAEGEVLSRERVLACQHEWGLLEANAADVSTPRAPGSKVFISYDRNNVRIAQQLRHDLNRAGLNAWLDLEGIAPDEPRWQTVIEAAIVRADVVLALASPESVDAVKSPNVAKELEVAVRAGRRTARLLVGGEAGDLPNTWRDPQLTDFSRRDYGTAFGELMRRLWPDIDVPVSLLELLSDPKYGATAAEAATRLGVDGTEQWVEGIRYVSLPLFVSGYTATDLMVPADARLELPNELRLLVHTTGPVENKAGSVLQDAIRAEKPPWLLYLRGHVVKGAAESYEMPFKASHIWDDTAAAIMRCLHDPLFSNRRVDLYFYGPAALAFEIGGRNREMGQHEFFAWDRAGSTYVKINWRRGTSHR